MGLQYSIKQALLILAPSMILQAIGMDAIISCIPAITQYFATHPSTTQWILGLFMLGTGIGQPIFGIVADLFGRKNIILFSIILYCSSSLACAAAGNIQQLILWRFFQGLGACGTLSVGIAIIRDQFEQDERLKVYSYLNGVIALSPLITPLLGGYLAAKTGSWHSVFYFLAIFSFIALIISAKYLKHDVIPTKTYNFKNILSAIQLILSNKNFLILNFGASIALTAMFLFSSISAICLIKHLALQHYHFSFCFGLNASIVLIGNFLCPVIQSYLGNIRTIIFSKFLILFGSSVMTYANLAYGLSIANLLLPMLCITLGVTLIIAISINLALEPFKNHAGTAAGIYGFLQNSIAGILGSLAMQLKLAPALILGGTMLVLSAISLAIFCNNYKISPK